MLCDDDDTLTDVRPGVYLHHGGGQYTVLFVATESTNARVGPGAKLVIYVSHTSGGLHARDQDEFREPIAWGDGVRRPRFTRCM